MFNGNFTVSETSNLGTIVLTDDSTGSDPNLTGRTINIFRADGSAFSDPISWPIADSSITLDGIFAKDIAVNIRVYWVSSSPLGSPSTYTKNIVYPYLDYLEYFLYYLTQLQLATPDIIQSDGYYANKTKVRCEIDNARNAIDFAADIKAAQSCIERAQFMIDNQNSFF